MIVDRLILICKPENLTDQEFSNKVRRELSQHSEIGNLNPVKLSKNIDSIYFVFNMKKSVEELGYKSLLFPLTVEQMLAIREKLDNGNMDEKDLKNITQEKLIDITNPIDAPIEEKVELKDIGSTEFEKKVANIIKILEGKGAEVEWNHKMPDPSKPDQPRQIDILIKKGGKVYHMECRHRSTAQDVTWIEQLVGRKITLGIDGIAAVSSSGFSTTAKKTAKNFGVALWELGVFNELDAFFWVGDLRFSMTTYKIKKLDFIFKIRNDNFNEAALSEISNSVKPESVLWPSVKQMLNKLSLQKLKSELKPQDTYLFEYSITFNSGFDYIENIKTSLTIESVTLQAQRVNKHSFGEYNGDVINTDAIIEGRTLPNFEIDVIQSKNHLGLVLKHNKIEDGNIYYTVPIIRVESGDLTDKDISMEIKNPESLIAEFEFNCYLTDKCGKKFMLEE
jgi:hypothetical protein